MLRKGCDNNGPHSLHIVNTPLSEGYNQFFSLVSDLPSLISGAIERYMLENFTPVNIEDASPSASMRSAPQDHVDMADGEDDDEPGNDVVHPVRDHLAAEHDIDPAKEHAADVVWLRHVVHGKAREEVLKR